MNTDTSAPHPSLLVEHTAAAADAAADTSTVFEFNDELEPESKKRPRGLTAGAANSTTPRFPFNVQFSYDSTPTPRGPASSTSSGKRVCGVAPSAGACAEGDDEESVQRRQTAWLDRLRVTADDVLRISQFVQGTAEWLKSREGRITASNFGAAAGLNPYMSPRALLKQLLWGGFRGCEATRWGQQHESTGKAAYLHHKREEFGIDSRTDHPDSTSVDGATPAAVVVDVTTPNLDGLDGDGDGNGDTARTGATARADGDDFVTRIEVEDTGLVINPERPWMGNSPDGIIHVTYQSGRTDRGLLEIKCPFKKTFYTPDAVPVYYYTQIQGTMGNLGLSWCDFVVWTPTGTQITRVPFDDVFWTEKLLPKVSDFYFKLYVPLAIKKEQGLLPNGQVTL
jgi:hypothetical protein